MTISRFPSPDARRDAIREEHIARYGSWPTLPDGQPMPVLLDTDIEWSIGGSRRRRSSESNTVVKMEQPR